MPIPNYQEIMLPLLKHSATGEDIWIQSCFDVLADQFALTPEEREKARSSGETVFSNRVRWAKTYMTQAGLLESTSRGHFKITDAGKKVLSESPAQIDNKYLRQFPAFVDFMKRSSSKDDTEQTEQETEETQTPEERIDEAQSEIEATLKDALLKQIYAASPAFFEKLILELMIAMGYGGAWQDSAQQVGRTGDGGIDGIINEDVLGLDVIYLQAKRYQPDNCISVDAIRGFSGALTGKGATKGVFVCTCKFSQPAREFAASNKLQKIVLIDGEDLTKLMIRHRVGVRVDRSIEIKKIDMDFFEEYGLS